jgi:hypothetical protein
MEGEWKMNLQKFCEFRRLETEVLVAPTSYDLSRSCITSATPDGVSSIWYSLSLRCREPMFTKRISSKPYTNKGQYVNLFHEYEFLIQ